MVRDDVLNGCASVDRALAQCGFFAAPLIDTFSKPMVVSPLRAG
jgi:hypothetical protein